MTEEKRLEEIRAQYFEAKREARCVGETYIDRDKEWLLSTINSLEEENERLRSLIRTQETEPPCDVPDDQTTEMAVRIATLESDLAKEREKNEWLQQRANKTIAAEIAEQARLINERDAANERGEKRREALEESVKLQSHYAMLLNMYDGGTRIEFKSADEWLARLQSLTDLKAKGGKSGDL